MWVHVYRTRQECQGLMLHPFEEWDNFLYISSSGTSLLSRKCLLVLSVFVWDSPSLPLAYPFRNFRQTDRRVLSRKVCQLFILPVFIRKDCLKVKACSKVRFLKDFQSFDILSFEKSVEEMMLRVMVFTFDDLDLC